MSAVGIALLVAICRKIRRRKAALKGSSAATTVADIIVAASLPVPDGSCEQMEADGGSSSNAGPSRALSRSAEIGVSALRRARELNPDSPALHVVGRDESSATPPAAAVHIDDSVVDSCRVHRQLRRSGQLNAMTGDCASAEAVEHSAAVQPRDRSGDESGPTRIGIPRQLYPLPATRAHTVALDDTVETPDSSTRIVVPRHFYPPASSPVHSIASDDISPMGDGSMADRLARRQLRRVVTHASDTTPAKPTCRVDDESHATQMAAPCTYRSAPVLILERDDTSATSSAPSSTADGSAAAARVARRQLRRIVTPVSDTMPAKTINQPDEESGVTHTTYI